MGRRAGADASAPFAEDAAAAALSPEDRRRQMELDARGLGFDYDAEGRPVAADVEEGFVAVPPTGLSDGQDAAEATAASEGTGEVRPAFPDSVTHEIGSAADTEPANEQ